VIRIVTTKLISNYQVENIVSVESELLAFAESKKK